jgi:hypothetical protein
MEVNMKVTALIACVTLALLAGTASAQVATTGTIVVIAQDEQAARLPGAIVTAEAADTTSRMESVTNERGEASLQLLQPSSQYVVTIELAGFAPWRQEAVLVRTGQTTTLNAYMSLAGVAEAVTVTASSPTVDVTTAQTGQDITLELTESLPTGRSYQDYLQLVPGVMPDDPDNPGNPASKSGLNYRDIYGDSGVSRDNFYYIDGINVTDGTQGTFNANLNTEVIQEQKVLTGGIPAEYIGTPGLVSNVILKSGSNTFTGSVNYFFQNDSLMAANKNFEDEVFSRYDAAFTIGGPVVQNKAWFFGSYRRLKKSTDVNNLDTGEFMRTIDDGSHQGYIKGTWGPTGKDTVSFTFLNDPQDISGSIDRATVNNRDRAREEGGNRYRFAYSRLMMDDALLLDVSYNKHDGDLNTLAADPSPFNTVSFEASQERSINDEQLGGYGEDELERRGTDLFQFSGSYSTLRHNIKAGLEFAQNKRFNNAITTGDPPAQWYSFDNSLAGINGDAIMSGSFSNLQFRPTNASDYNGTLVAIDASPDRDLYYATYDTNGDGTISVDEFSQNIVFDSTAGNPNGKVNYYRSLQSRQGPIDLKSRSYSWYVQDGFDVGPWYFNLGLRAERYRHYASTGEDIYTFPWTWAPRLAATWDIKRDGTQKLSVYWGKYFDPVRNNMTSFAGTLTGPINEEQVYLLGNWLSYRIRGGEQMPDAIFAPTTKTPWTDDLQIGYQVDLGKNMSFEGLYTKRRTRDILEDYDLSLYAYRDDGTTIYPGDPNAPGSLFLGLDYFGFDSFPISNFVIATLAGAERNYQGVEFIFRKRYSDNWQALFSYTYNDAEGNSNSDSNADFQGDVLFLDPRAPNQYGPQPGSIHHLLKVAGTYMFDFGLEVGASVGWNSGTLASQTFRLYRRNLPLQVDEPYVWNGVTEQWLLPNVVGSLTNPSWTLANIRVQYRIRPQERLNLQIFADFFNLFDNQDSIRDQDVVAGEGGVAFGDGIKFNRPRRLFLGVRLNW